MVTQFPQMWQSKGVENLSNLRYMTCQIDSMLETWDLLGWQANVWLWNKSREFLSKARTCHLEANLFILLVIHSKDCYSYRTSFPISLTFLLSPVASPLWHKMQMYFWQPILLPLAIESSNIGKGMGMLVQLGVSIP